MQGDLKHYGEAGMLVNPILERHSIESKILNKDNGLRIFPLRLCESLRKKLPVWAPKA